MAGFRALTIQSGLNRQVGDSQYLVVGGGVQRASVGALELGTDTDTTSLTIGRTGVTATVAGNLAVTGTLQVTGTQTFVGGSTFNSNATFEGDVTFGNAATDNVRFFSVVGDATYPNFTFSKELNHNITVEASTTATLNGGRIAIESGIGADAGAGIAGEGGRLYLYSGGGGAGSATNPGGAGGLISCRGGAGGASVASGGLPGVGGDVQVTGGLGGAGASDRLGGTGGTATLAGGTGGADGGYNPGAGGDVTIRSGHAGSGGTGDAGSVSIQSGTGNSGSLSVGTSSAFADITMNAEGNIYFQNQSNLALSVNVGTAPFDNAVEVRTGTVLRVQSGATNATIDLPNDATNKFRIDDVAVGSTVTSANLNTVTNGSNADALHTHSVSSVGQVAFTVPAYTGLATGDAAGMYNDGGTAKAAQTDPITSFTGATYNFVGHALTVSGGNANLVTHGLVSIPTASFTGTSVAASHIGSPVYLSTSTNGRYSVDVPSGSGNWFQQVGIVSGAPSGGNVNICLQPMTGVILA
jgi:hypothetical protein